MILVAPDSIAPKSLGVRLETLGRGVIPQDNSSLGHCSCNRSLSVLVAHRWGVVKCLVAYSQVLPERHLIQDREGVNSTNHASSMETPRRAQN
ncbi:predicted protein [Plenodomus lingam JN3]|uniref:Predicted protein n=1 Tax=Leptosphaeria maculans (strain JN3 / isolate v23.1.3 / race Av1-4-5-6-7-8) TaxID=985895 RepID=E5ACB7_LEPMJ|nr:predicted protein [Plenodomus lingam JN3]CBY02119.1 predicted protein [Plenodomus lingam JN3]